jgi:hypothetical protein
MEASTLPAPTGPAIGIDPTRPTPGFCGCGCGEPTARRYRPGHDAKHHSTLAAALLSADWRIATRAADLLADLGWTSYADRAALQAVPYRTSNGLAVQVLADVATFQVTPCGQHHANRRCPALTAQARAAGALNRTTRLAADSWLEFVPNSPALTDRLLSSWDQCTTCTVDTDRLVTAEVMEVRVTALLERSAPKVLKSSPTSWLIPSDGDGPDLVGWWNHTTGKTGRGPALAPPQA